MEVGAGLHYAHPEKYVTMELNSRWQLAHDADGFAEWGVSGSLRYDPRPPSELGLSFTLSPSWGTGTSGGVDALWKRADMAALAANGYAEPAGRIDAELAYGFVTLDGLAIGTPLTGGLAVGEYEGLPSRLPDQLRATGEPGLQPEL